MQKQPKKKNNKQNGTKVDVVNWIVNFMLNDVKVREI